MKIKDMNLNYTLKAIQTCESDINSYKTNMACLTPHDLGPVIEIIERLEARLIKLKKHKEQLIEEQNKKPQIPQQKKESMSPFSNTTTQELILKIKDLQNKAEGMSEALDREDNNPCSEIRQEFYSIHRTIECLKKELNSRDSQSVKQYQ